MANVLSKGTYVGVALDVGAGALEIQEACSVGREERCTKAKYVEGSKSVLGVASAGMGGLAGVYAAGAVCVAVGIPTGGVGALACAVIGSAAGGYLGGQAGSYIGEKSALTLYEHVAP